MRPRDTSPEIHRLQIERYRRMTGEARVLQAVSLSEDLHRLTEAGLRARHPAYSDEQVRWALRRMHLGSELFGRVWPDGPVVAP